MSSRVERIVSGISKVLAKLEAEEERLDTKAVGINDHLATLEADLDVCLAERGTATRFRKNISKLLEE